MAKVTMPQLGESVAEGTIGKWLKQPGDHVAKYEPLVEVVTDKVNAEVPSPFEGILREILAEEGAVVPNNAEIASSRRPTTAPSAGGPAAPSAPSGDPAAATAGRRHPTTAGREARAEPAPARRRPARGGRRGAPSQTAARPTAQPAPIGRGPAERPPLSRHRRPAPTPTPG